MDRIRKPLLPALLLLLHAACPAAVRAEEADVVVYGGTSASVIAAVQARKMGKSVVLVSPDKHLGGLSSGGLGFTDTGNNRIFTCTTDKSFNVGTYCNSCFRLNFYPIHSNTCDKRCFDDFRVYTHLNSF